MLKTKLIITEEQLVSIARLIKEDADTKIVKQVADYLSAYYEPSFVTQEESGAYDNTAMILNKVDDSHVTPKNLLRHLMIKFNLSPEFLAQVIRDWYDGNLDNGGFVLSQNVSVK